MLHHKNKELVLRKFPRNLDHNELCLAVEVPLFKTQMVCFINGKVNHITLVLELFNLFNPM